MVTLGKNSRKNGKAFEKGLRGDRKMKKKKVFNPNRFKLINDLLRRGDITPEQAQKLIDKYALTEETVIPKHRNWIISKPTKKKSGYLMPLW